MSNTAATHLCPLARTESPLDRSWCIDRFAEVLTDLPADLAEADVLHPELRLCSEGRLSLYYVPFERVNPVARVIFVGLTPGRHQLWLAVKEAGQVLREGGAIPAALEAAVAAGSFGGPMRRNLVGMLDEIGIAKWLGLTSTHELWTPAASRFVSFTSAVLHPVFIDGANYSGSRPRIAESRLLSAFVDQVLAAELAHVPEALVVPLGTAVSDAVGGLVAMGQVDPNRVLIGFPHPSPANGHRKRTFTEHRTDLTAQVDQWASRFPLAAHFGAHTSQRGTHS